MQRRAFLVLGAASLASGAIARAANAGSSRVAVIVAQSSPLADISLGDLRRIFLSQVRNHAGERIVPFNQPRHTLPRRVFDERVLGMGPEESARYWVDQRIRGSSKPPRPIASPQLLLRVVSQFPGAIGYLQETDLGDGVKALKVSGSSLADDDYPIR
jgi:hypothetical protein